MNVNAAWYQELVQFRYACDAWMGVEDPADPATCLHENTDHYKNFDGSDGAVEFLGCLDCRSLLALDLGPAKDSGLVMIELRAAEIVAGGYAIPAGPFGGRAERVRSMHWFEGCGWNTAYPNPDDLGHKACDNGEPEDGPLHQAGYLAAIIVHHDKEQP